MMGCLFATRNRRVGCFVVVAASALLAALLLPQRAQPTITQASCDRIQLGMTPEQVEQLLGGPDGVYTSRSVVVVMDGADTHRRRRRWFGDEGVIVIELSFFDHKTVIEKSFDPFPPETFGEVLQRLLPRYPQWIAW